jgi:hypothetical protein
MKTKIILGIIIISMILITGCSDGKGPLTDETLKDEIIKANTNLNSYDFEGKMNMIMILDTEEESFEIGSETSMIGEIDREKKQAKIKMDVKTTMAEMPIEMTFDTYIMDEYIYVGIMGQWSKIKYEEDEWVEQDQVEQMLQLVYSGDITLDGTETINEKEYYKVTIKPDLEKLAELVLQTQELIPFAEITNIQDLIRDYEETIWINKETYIIEITKSKGTIVMSAKDFGEEGEGELKMIYDSEFTMNNINKNVNINLPNEAINAKEAFI